jgi:hypothetical protein
MNSEGYTPLNGLVSSIACTAAARHRRSSSSIMSSSDCVDFVAARHPGRGTLDQPPHRFARLLRSYSGDSLSMAV